MGSTPIAVFCSDIHLSHKAPVARSVEADWYETMGKALDQVREVAGDLPIFCAGDIFDRWNSPPELINFAIKRLPKMFAIPGQHDLPNHNLDDIKRSAYWTLVEAGTIVNLEDPMSIEDNRGWVYPFPWGVPVKPVEKADAVIEISLVHSYIWTKGSTYPGADTAAHWTKWKRRLKGYDVAVFGDNHKGFFSKTPSGTQILNCGTLMRRKIDEIDYKPHIGLLYENGTVEPHFLDTKGEKFMHEIDRVGDPTVRDMSDFIRELGSLGEDSLDFRGALIRRMDSLGIDQEVRSIVDTCLEE